MDVEFFKTLLESMNAFGVSEKQANKYGEEFTNKFEQANTPDLVRQLTKDIIKFHKLKGSDNVKSFLLGAHMVLFLAKIRQQDKLSSLLGPLAELIKRRGDEW